MRRQLIIMVAAGVFVGLIGSAALAASRPGPAPREPRDPSTAAPVAVQGVAVPAPVMRDEAAMVLVGTALIGLGAALRRAA